MLNTCIAGHQFYKSSDCLTCPICEAAKKPKQGWLANINAPARRALERAGITSLIQLSQYRDAEILQLHGMGPTTLPKLEAALDQAGLAFRCK